MLFYVIEEIAHLYIHKQYFTSPKYKNIYDSARPWQPRALPSKILEDKLLPQGISRARFINSLKHFKKVFSFYLGPIEAL